MAKDPVERYFRTRYGGGRGAFARALDYIALRLILLAATYLFYRSRFDEIWIVLSLSALTLGLGMILMRLCREVAYARFVRRERERLRRLVLADRLMLAPGKDLKALCKTLLRPREAAALLVCAKPADANATRTTPASTDPLCRRRAASTTLVTWPGVLRPGGWNPDNESRHVGLVREDRDGGGGRAPAVAAAAACGHHQSAASRPCQNPIRPGQT